MSFVLCLHRSVLTIVFGVLLVGCVAHRTDDRSRQQQAEVNQRLSAVPPLTGKLTADPDEPCAPRENAVPSEAAERQSIQQGNSLFHSKAGCVDCHDHNGESHSRAPSHAPTFALPPTDLRTPTDKSVRQLYLIIKYGVPATGMRPLHKTVTLRDEDILTVIAYL